MEALKDEVGDLRRRCWLNPPASGRTIASISLSAKRMADLPCRKSGPSIVNWQLHIPMWLGYRSKQELKTPTIGVRRACAAAGHRHRQS